MRKKYDWLFIIEDQNLNMAFWSYCQYHYKVKSAKRLARSFVVGFKPRINFRLPCYEVGQTEHREDYYKHLALVKWIDG